MSKEPQITQSTSKGPDLIIITGMSGAGRTQAMHTFEDLGYFCIDNLPPAMLEPLVKLVDLASGSGKPLAVVCDVRSEHFFGELMKELDKLSEQGINYSIIFLEASNSVLVSRYSALRRRHPLSQDGMSLTEAINEERRLLSNIKERANMVIDTTDLPTRELRALLQKRYTNMSAEQGMSVTVFSFGFKHGNPVEADIIMDVRFLPNPYYIPELRPLTGFDEPVYTYVIEREETEKFLKAWYNLLDSVMPGYVSEGKQHLSIGIGCTGGQHRSVVLAEATASYLSSCGYRVSTAHRDTHRAKRDK